jgi:glycosyltransferase involved in cell wall biosynthesis
VSIPVAAASIHVAVPGLISVVLPTYNRQATLLRSIASVLAQSYTALELIVIDDCSTDRSAELVAAIDDPRLRYVPLPVNGGVSAARNRGVSEARGEWVAFQDSDDEWLPQHLQRLLEAMQTLGADYGIVMCLSRCPEDANFSYDPLPGRPDFSDAAELVLRRLPVAPCWLARRDHLLRAGLFDLNLNCFEEWELALRVSEFSHIGLLNEVQHLYHRTPGSLFSNTAGYVRNLTLILNRHGAKWAGRDRDLAMYQTLIGHMSCIHGSAADGRDWFRRAIVTSPRALRPRLSLLVSLFGQAPYRLFTNGVRRGRYWLKMNLRREA